MIDQFKAMNYRVYSPTSSELNLLSETQVSHFFDKHKFDVVVHAAARVGGVLGNKTYPATFIQENLQMQNNVFTAASKNKVNKLVFVASSCIYPIKASIPLAEESIFTGKFEPTNRWYATAKAAGIMQVEAIRLQYGLEWFSVLPTNIYGINDNFALESGHVVPSLLRKFAESIRDNSGEVVIWGTGEPRREFIHAEDVAKAILHLLVSNFQLPEPFIINLGSDESADRKLSSGLLHRIRA